MSDTTPYLVQSPNGPHRFPDFATADQWARERAVIWPGAEVILTGPEGTTYYLPSRAELAQRSTIHAGASARCVALRGVRCCEFGADR